MVSSTCWNLGFRKLCLDPTGHPRVGARSARPSAPLEAAGHRASVVGHRLSRLLRRRSRRRPAFAEYAQSTLSRLGVSPPAPRGRRRHRYWRLLRLEGRRGRAGQRAGSRGRSRGGDRGYRASRELGDRSCDALVSFPSRLAANGFTVVQDDERFPLLPGSSLGDGCDATSARRRSDFDAALSRSTDLAGAPPTSGIPQPSVIDTAARPRAVVASVLSSATEIRDGSLCTSASRLRAWRSRASRYRGLQPSPSHSRFWMARRSLSCGRVCGESREVQAVRHSVPSPPPWIETQSAAWASLLPGSLAGPRAFRVAQEQWYRAALRSFGARARSPASPRSPIGLPGRLPPSSIPRAGAIAMTAPMIVIVGRALPPQAHRSARALTPAAPPARDGVGPTIPSSHAEFPGSR